MLGFVIAIVAAAAPALPGAGVTCAEGADSCELAPLVVAQHEQRTYATPAVIDCSSPAVPLVLSAMVGECDGTPYDASYWVSRDPASESATAVLAPASRDRRTGVAACDGLPQKAPGLTLSDTQPLAVFATPTLVTTGVEARAPGDALEVPSRLGDPPDRPPRV